MLKLIYYNKGVIMLKKVLLGLSLFFALSYAQEPSKGILLTKSVFVEKMVWDNIRGNIRKMVSVKTVKKGATLVYLNEVINQSSRITNRVVIDNPIPYGTTYIRGTSRCEGVCEMLYSIDGGTTFKQSEKLYVVYGTKRRVPMDSEYTHIKFIFSKLAPYEKVRMSFKARAK
jgi:uncharacterized repeat protein (TIGR01451 family)